MNKIIFLDFDGVLNTEVYQKVLNQQCENWQDEHGALFDPNAVIQLKRIIDATNAILLLSHHGSILG